MNRLTEDRMLELAARGVGKVDQLGLRGVTLVTMDEIEAMACTLACLGIRPIEPGSYPNPNRIPHTEGERA